MAIIPTVPVELWSDLHRAAEDFRAIAPWEFYDPAQCRSAYRIRHAPDFRNDLHKGFRVAAPAPKTP